MVFALAMLTVILFVYTSYKMHLSPPASDHQLVFALKLSHPTCVFWVFGESCLLWGAKPLLAVVLGIS